jgi:alkaline phosphatase
VWNKADFDAINPSSTSRLMGLFEPSHVQYETDRLPTVVNGAVTVDGDKAGEPSLTDMTTKAIDILSKNRKGYFLMVEGGRIDHGHHAGNAYRALTDAIAFSDAVAAAAAKCGPDTLIVVTADHSHVFTIAGYPDRGNPILGLMKTGGVIQKDMLGLPYTTLGYQNGAGYFGKATLADKTTVDQAAGPKTQGFGAPFYPANFEAFTGRADLTNVDTTAKGFMQDVAVPLNNETHAGEDVAIFAKGPNAHLFHGSLDQSMIYYIMADALRLNP